MDVQLLLMVQIAADLVLCFAILFLLRQLNRKKQSPPPAPPSSAVSEETMHEFRMLLGESQQAANSFLESMEESRKKLREVVCLLDNKEKSCREIIEQSVEMRNSFRKEVGEGLSSPPDHRYGVVIELSEQGMTEDEIARQTGLTGGEVRLTLNLHRSRNEND